MIRCRRWDAHIEYTEVGVGGDRRQKRRLMRGKGGTVGTRVDWESKN